MNARGGITSPRVVVDLERATISSRTSSRRPTPPRRLVAVRELVGDGEVEATGHVEHRRRPAVTEPGGRARSVVCNWLDEAARFAPKLRVIEHGGPDRRSRLGDLDGADLIVTSYATPARRR